MPPSETSWGPAEGGRTGRVPHLSLRGNVVGGGSGTLMDKADGLGAVPGADSGRGPLLSRRLLLPKGRPVSVLTCPSDLPGPPAASSSLLTAPFTRPMLLHQHALRSVDNEGIDEPRPCFQEPVMCVVWGRPAGTEGPGPRAPSSYRGSDVASILAWSGFHSKILPSSYCVPHWFHPQRPRKNQRLALFISVYTPRPKAHFHHG